MKQLLYMRKPTFLLLALFSFLPASFAVSQSPETSFQNAFTEENLPKLKELIARYPALLDRRNEYGETPLFRAVEQGNIKLTRFLIEAGANPNLQSETEEHVLYITAFDNNIVLVNYLLQSKKIDVDLEGPDGMNPLAIAFCNDHKDMANLLLKHGASLYVRNYEGKTPLHWVCQSEDPNMIQWMLAYKKVDLFIPDKRGIMPIHSLCQSGSREVIKYLIKAQPELVKSQDKVSNLLHYAIEAVDDEEEETASKTVEFLLKDYSPLVNCEDLKGDTPLTLAKRKFKTDYPLFKRIEHTHYKRFILTPALEHHLACTFKNNSSFIAIMSFIVVTFLE